MGVTKLRSVSVRSRKKRSFKIANLLPKLSWLSSFTKLPKIKLWSNKRSRWPLLFSLLFLLIAIPAAFYFNSRTPQVEAAWWNAGWMYRRAIPITNSGSEQTDFQVLIKVDTASLIAAGKLQDDCDDIRFTNISGKSLSYFQATACDAAVTRYWVKIDKIPTPASTVYVYYGNSNAEPGSNQDNTFDLSLMGTYSQTFADSQIASNHGVSSDRENSFFISNSTYINRFNLSWVYQQQFSSLDLYTGVCYDDKLDRFYGIDWSNKQWSTFTTSFVEIDPMDQTLGDQPIDCATDSTYLYTNHRSGLLKRNLLADNTSSTINMDALSGFDWGGQGITYAYGYIFAGTSTYGENVNRIYVLDIADWDNPKIVTYWDASGHELGEVAGLTWKDKYIYQTSRSNDFANEWQGPVKTAVTEPIVGSLAAEETTPGPIAEWKLDEGAGTEAKNSIPGGSTGSITNAAWQTEEQCVSGKCLYFDGSSYVNLNLGNGRDISNQPISISMWVKAANPTGAQMFLGSSLGTNQRMYLGTTNGRWGMGIQTATWGGGTEATQLNKWNHVYLITDGSNAQMYIDGKLTQQASYTSFSLASNLALGAAGPNGAYKFVGYIDEVTMYPYARTVDQIKQDYNHGFSTLVGQQDQGTLSDGLVGYWKMDEGSWGGASGEVIDSSGNGNNGTSTGGATVNIGKYGNGGYFDGVDDRVTIPDNDNLDIGTGSKTWTMWFNTSEADSGYMYRKSDGCNQNGTIIYHNNGNAVAYITIGACGSGQSVILASSGTDYSDGQWHHVAAVLDRDTSTYTLFVDGEQKDSDSASLFDGLDLNAGAAPNFSGSANYNGLLDEVRIYDRALSANEIKSVYNYAPGPVGHWKMDEGSGTTSVTDSSGNYLTGTMNNIAATSWTQGKFGGGLLFDSTDDYIALPSAQGNLLNPKAVTTEAWVNFNEPISATHRPHIVGKGSGYYLIVETTGYPKMYIYDTTWRQVQGTTQISTDTWYHLAGTYDGTTLKIFVNGKLENSSGPYGNANQNANEVAIGRSGGTASHYVGGTIDDVRIYNYARTPQQVVQDMNAGHPAGGSPVGSQLAYWKFDEGGGQSVNDSVGSNTGTLGANSSVSTDDPTWESENNCKFGRCIDLDSSSYQYVAIPHSSNLTPTEQMTITAWIKPETLLGDNRQWIVKDNGTGYMSYIDQTGKLYFRLYTSGGSITAAGNSILTIGNWYHITLTYDGSSARTYINGVLDLEQALTGTITTNTLPLNIGADCVATCNETSDHFDGLIDEVKIYSSALTAEQILIDMNQNQAMNYGAGGDSEATIMTDGAGAPPVGEWKLDEGTGTVAKDTSGQGIDGSVAGGATWKSGCHQGNCLNLGNQTDNSYLSLPSDASQLKQAFSAMTIEAWVYPTAFSSGNYGPTVISNTDNHGWALRINDGYIKPDFRLSSGSINQNIGTEQLPLNEWSHVVVTYNGSSIDGYLNGRKIGSISASGTMNNTSNLNTCTFIGNEPGVCNPSGGEFDFPGNIDLVRVYDYARTPGQIAYDYNRGKPVAHYKFDECEGGTIHDSSENGNHGTWNGAGSGSITSVGTCSTSGTAWGNGSSGKFNASMVFDGSNDYISVPYSSELKLGNLGSVSAWYKPTTLSSRSRAIVSYGAGNEYSTGYLINQYSTQLMIYWRSGGSIATIDNFFPTTGDWYHVTVVNNNGEISIYRNGEIMGTGTSAGTITADYTTNFGGSGLYFADTQIDDVQIFNYALSADQVKQLTNEGFATRFGE